VSVEEGRGERRVSYRLGEGWHAEPRDVYETEAEALAAATFKIEEIADREDEHRRVKKDMTLRHASWTVGYHLREAKEHQRQIAYHTARAVILKARGKVTP
jgi:hypothetical protein